MHVTTCGRCWSVDVSVGIHLMAYHQMNWQSESKKAWAFRSDEMVQRNVVVTQSTTVSGLCWRLPARVPRPMLWSPPRVTATYINNFL